jgi:stalled ribosome alternative rescue factor ArfA
MKTKQFKVRRHQALFDSNLPFKHKVEKSKVTYSRKLKHKGNLHD